MGFNFPFSIIAWGQQYIPYSLTAILMGINLILTLILSYFLLKDEEITTLKIFGILIGFLGLILLIGLNNSDIVDLNSMFMFANSSFTGNFIIRFGNCINEKDFSHTAN